MITLYLKLTFENEKYKKQLIELMRKISSCYRYAYNRLLEEQKRKDLKKHLQKMFNLLNKQLKLLKSLYSDPQAQEAVNQWKKQMRDLSLWTGYKLWLALKVALAIPVLGKSLNRDLSPLKPVLIERDWIG